MRPSPGLRPATGGAVPARKDAARGAAFGRKIINSDALGRLIRRPVGSGPGATFLPLDFLGIPFLGGGFDATGRCC